MEDLMLRICNILSDSLNYIIFILAMVEVAIMAVSAVILYRLRHKIKNFFKGNKRRNGRARKIGKHMIYTEEVTVLTRDWDEFVEFRHDYQKRIIWYDVFSSFIQLFPLLGILGTVAGLYISTSLSTDIYQGVEFALSSTIWGIICAVIFKFFDAIFVALFINYIDDGIDRYEKDFGIINEEAKSCYSMPDLTTSSNSSSH